MSTNDVPGANPANRDEVVESRARAMFETCNTGWTKLPAEVKKYWRVYAEAIMKADEVAGYALVPREATEEMFNSYKDMPRDKNHNAYSKEKRMADDDERKARNLISTVEQLLIQHEHKEADFVATAALREARQQGMREAAEIARLHTEDSYSPSWNDAANAIAQAIERAADEQSKGGVSGKPKNPTE